MRGTAEKFYNAMFLRQRQKNIHVKLQVDLLILLAIFARISVKLLHIWLHPKFSRLVQK